MMTVDVKEVESSLYQMSYRANPRYFLQADPGGMPHDLLVEAALEYPEAGVRYAWRLLGESLMQVAEKCPREAINIAHEGLDASQIDRLVRLCPCDPPRQAFRCCSDSMLRILAKRIPRVAFQEASDRMDKKLVSEIYMRAPEDAVEYAIGKLSQEELALASDEIESNEYYANLDL